MDVSDDNDRLDDQIFVRNLAYDTTYEDLTKAFEVYGPLKRVSVALDKETNRSRGFGFIAYAIAEDANRALTAMQGKSLNDRVMKLELAAKRDSNALPSKKVDNGIADDDVSGNNKSTLNEIERLRREERKSRAMKNKAQHQEDDGENEDNEDMKNKNGTSVPTTLDIKHPNGVRPGLQLILFGVPSFLKKKDMQKLVVKVNRKTEIEMISQDHYLVNYLTVVSPAGKVFVLTAPNKAAVSKLITSFNDVSPNVMLKTISITSEDAEQNKKIKTKFHIRTLAQLTPPLYRKRHCRLIIRNLSFQASEENIADKLGKYGPLSEVSIPRKVDEREPTRARIKNKMVEGETRTKPIGFAFVTFLCTEDANNAVTACADAVASNKSLRICNREVAVDFCQSKDRYNTEIMLEGREKELDDIGVDQNDQNNANEKDENDENDEKEDEENDDQSMDASAAIDDNDSDQNSNDSSSSSDNDGSDSDSNDEDGEDTEESSKSPSKAPESDIKEGCTVFVRGLALNTDQREIRTRLKEFGRITMAIVVKDSKGESKGTAFVKFSTSSEARACVTASEASLGLLIENHKCRIDMAVEREQAALLKSEEKEKRDKRHLYLANEGLSFSRNDLNDMSVQDQEKRKLAQADKKKRLTNPLFFVSSVRLSVRNLNKSVDDQTLRTICFEAAQKGLQKKLVTEVDQETLLVAEGTPIIERTSTKKKIPEIKSKKALKSAKIMRDMQRLRDGVPQSRGFGFVEFLHHSHALACLRELNNNKAYSKYATTFSEEAMPQKGGGGKDAARPKASKLIVEFCLENFRKVSILKQREERQQERTKTLKDSKKADGNKGKDSPKKENVSDREKSKEKMKSIDQQDTIEAIGEDDEQVYREDGVTFADDGNAVGDTDGAFKSTAASIYQEIGQKKKQKAQERKERKKRNRQKGEGDNSGENVKMEQDNGDDANAEDAESKKLLTPAAKRRKQEARRREKIERREEKKNKKQKSAASESVAPASSGEKSSKKRGGMFSRIRAKKKAKKEEP